jgi:hemerythrin superfamily protein
VADIFTALTHDHQEVKTMLDQLEQGAGNRADLAERLVMEESRHEAAEEQYFWPAVRDKLADGDTLAEQAIKQENQGKQVLDQIRKISPDNIEFETLITTFIKDAREHIAFEEEQVWPSMRQTLSDEEALELGEKFELAKKLGPTRPHPNTPANPTVLKTAGTAAAMVDKATDALTGRGKNTE